MADDSKGARIAIKFGASSSSTKTPASTLGKRPRAAAAAAAASSSSRAAFGGDSDSDSDHGRHEAITGFGVDGAETKRRKEAVTQKEYVIARQPNRDWRDEVREQRRARRARNPPPGEAAQDGTADRAPADQDSNIRWGLTVKERKNTAADDDDDDDDDDDADNANTADNADRADDAQGTAAPRSADDEAMDALLGKRRAAEAKTIVAATEDDAYARDVSAAGAAPTLADYDAMPVEEFGAALLRGMGWDGTTRGGSKPPKRRQNRLGLGAKELDDAEELGLWDQRGGRRKRPPTLADHRREEERKKEERRARAGGEGYRRGREREREGERRAGRATGGRGRGSARGRGEGTGGIGTGVKRGIGIAIVGTIETAGDNEVEEQKQHSLAFEGFYRLHYTRWFTTAHARYQNRVSNTTMLC
ncbi:hypothetical protein ISF_08755 [Cordyceps fumosorosea ARSEF 2679]|uniref:Pre-mRNA-splicing factor n=1 Tax=Cordyceps fumosorosea (strain ARSEF 2679) TaxID=1081104 RepID=A0A167LR82_CORFA|nr:hypothetical protein ISF_08755 [Cordyceps fumosorosea ARSEF 2679]OAA53402.1 hypothetical protein ISF_08755 [Cordyceps fumosorosea ARSEF 2679]